MSIFEKVINRRKAIELERIRLEKAKAEAHQHAKDAFKVAFIEAWKTIAVPVFDAFVSDAKAHGYDANVKVLGNSTSQYGGAIRLMPVRGEPLPVQSSEHVFVFALGGEPYDQVVTIRFHFENTTKKIIPQENDLKGGLEMICKEQLEAALENFLISALEALPCTKSDFEIIPVKKTIINTESIFSKLEF